MSRTLVRAATAVLVLLHLAPSALAVPAPVAPIELRNRDGSTLWGRMFGDEQLSWLEDLSGYALAFDSALGAFCYAELGPDGRLRPTPFVAGSVDPAALGLAPHLRPSVEVRRQARALRDARPPSPPPSPGTVPNLVLLVRFSNQTTRFAPADYEPVFNGDVGSVRDYWQEASLGRIDLRSTVTEEWIPLPHDDSYYVYNQERYGHPERMIIDAVAYLDQQGFDFTRFDRNPQDGILDAVAVIHSGPGYETTGDPRYIHSHFADLRWYGLDFLTHDGIRVVAYHTEPEFRGDGGRIVQIGVICHESGHYFGLPDLYDYDGDSAGVGMWCLMASGPWAGPYMNGTWPTLLSAWGKAKLGFLNPIALQISTRGLVLQPSWDHAEAVILSTGMPSREYFILENRQQLGYDQYLPGEGLLIQHADDDQPDNNDQSHYMVDIEQADGLRELNNDPWEMGDWGDVWPYNNVASTFGPMTNPASTAYGETTSRITVSGIARDGDDVLFDVTLEGTSGSMLMLRPTQVSFTGAVGAVDPPPAEVRVLHQGEAALSWTATPQEGWLSTSPVSGSTPGAMEVGVVTAGLPAGQHEGTIVFSAPGALSDIPLYVHLRVDPFPPEIVASPASLTFETQVGLPPPPPMVLEITNGGGGTLVWSAALDADASWASLSSAAGRAPSTLEVGADPTGLAVGTYPGTLTLSAAGVDPMEVPLALVIAPPPHLEVSPAALVFAGIDDVLAPEPQMLRVGNAGGGFLYFEAVGSPGWVDVLTPEPAYDGATDVVVSLDVEYLGAGDYAGTVTITAEAADNSPVVVPVTFHNPAPNRAPGAPTLLAPADLARVEGVFPELRVANAVDPDGDALTYDFEVVGYPDLAPVALETGAPAGAETTAHVLATPLELDATYQWRARAVDEHGLAGPWSEESWTFQVVRPEGSGCASAGSGGLGLVGLALLRARRSGRRTGSRPAPLPRP